MAIVKCSFTRRRGAAKANIRYIAHRAGKEGEKITRQLFGADGDLTKEQAYSLVDGAGKGTLFFRLKLNFDPRKEDTKKDLDLQEITIQTMLTLKEQLQRDVQFVATMHDDHTPLRHVHILALVQGRLNVADLKAMKDEATQQALAQRGDRDRALARQVGRRIFYPAATFNASKGVRPSRPLGTPPNCPRCETPMFEYANLCLCLTCDLKFLKDRSLMVEGKEYGWGE